MQVAEAGVRRQECTAFLPVPAGPHPGQDLIFRFVCFCGRQPRCLVGRPCPAGAGLLLAALKIVTQGLRQPLSPRVSSIPRRLGAASQPRRVLLVIITLHGHALAQKRALRKPQDGFRLCGMRNNAGLPPIHASRQHIEIALFYVISTTRDDALATKRGQKLRNAACAHPQAMAIGASPDAASHEPPPDAAIAQG